MCVKYLEYKEKFATIATALTLQLYKGGSGDKDKYSRYKKIENWLKYFWCLLFFT